MAFQYPTNITSLAGFLRYGNIVTNNLFGIVILLLVFIILMIRLKEYPLPRAYGAAAFTVSILGAFFRAINLVSDFVFIFCIFIFVSAIIVLRLEEN